MSELDNVLDALFTHGNQVEIDIPKATAELAGLRDKAEWWDALEDTKATEEIISKAAALDAMEKRLTDQLIGSDDPQDWATTNLSLNVDRDGRFSIWEGVEKGNGATLVEAVEEAKGE